MTRLSELGANGLKVPALGPIPPVTEASLSNLSRTVNTIVTALTNQVRPLPDQAGPWQSLARIVGGELFRVTAGTSVDVELFHGLGRLPYAVFASWSVDGKAGQVVGSPSGGTSTPSDPINETAWTSDRAYVRATRSGTWIILLV